MNFFDKVLGWVGYAVDKVKSLRERIQGGVTQAAAIAQVAAKALDKYGDKLAALEPSDLAWFFGPVTTAIAAAQANALVSGTIGPERLEAVRLALMLAKHGVEKADAAFDAQWARINPHVEAFIATAKDEKALGFEK